MADIRVKICGLRSRADIEACAKAGAAYVGFVFYPKSPRHLEISQAQELAIEVPPGIAKVALVVNASDAELDALLADVPIDLLQLHGSETPERVAQLRDRFGLPVMKAVGIAGEGDLGALEDYAQICDQILVDAKPSDNADLPGGNGLAFDWRLLAGRRWSVPWMLAGGLTAENVADAVRLTGAKQVDVSSGVERARGVKDAKLIHAFVESAQRQ